jgi:hypothetical protein
MPSSTSYVCFDCRRAVKGPAFLNPHERRPKALAGLRAQPARCPECALPMQIVGSAFKAPRKNDLKQWEKVRRMVQEGGYIFYPNRGRTPKTLAEVDQFLDVIRRQGKRKVTSKAQNARSRPAKLATALSGPSYGSARSVNPPLPSRSERVARAKARLKRRKKQRP